MINPFNRFSIRGRSIAASQSKQGYLFMGISEKETHEELRLTRRMTTNIATNDHHIFQCETCQTRRVFGHSPANPERSRYLLYCEGKCHSHTWHSFISMGI